MVGAASKDVEGRLEVTKALGVVVCGIKAVAEVASKNKRANTVRMV